MRLSQESGLTRGHFVSGAAALVVGAIFGWAVSEIFGDPSQVQLWVVCAISAIAFLAITAIVATLTQFEEEGNRRVTRIEDALRDLRAEVTGAIETSAVLVPRESIYPEMARCVREATDQVVVLTYFMYDWESDKRTFEPQMGRDLEGLDEFYSAVYDCIRNPAVEYLRVWQVPEERVSVAREKILQHDRLGKEIQLIESLSSHPEQCRMKIIPQATTASIILVDKTTMFFNVDFRDLETGLWMSPFMLLIRDARGKAFSDMKRVILKLTGS